MIRIELGKKYKFLSGRSIAIEVINQYSVEQLRAEDIEIDFSKVESCTQSFLSELVFQLKERNVNPGKIRCVSFEAQKIKDRMGKELERLGMLSA